MAQVLLPVWCAWFAAALWAVGAAAAPLQAVAQAGQSALRPTGAAGWLGRRTWVVDDDGGPGVNFLDIQPAVDAAADGDLIRVLPGTYSPVHCNKSISLLGPGNSSTSAGGANLHLDGVTGSVAVVGLVFSAVELTDSPGTILLDDVVGRGYGAGAQSPTLKVANCADVRLIDCRVEGRPDSTLVELGSRVELITSTLIGGPGYSPGCNEAVSGGQGGRGLKLEHSRLHAVDTACIGGRGGDGIHEPLLGCSEVAFGGRGGNGGGMTSADLVASSSEFRGGAGGEAQGLSGSTCGDGGNGLSGSGAVQHSGVSFVAGLAGPGEGVCSPGKKKTYNPNTGALPIADPYLLRPSLPAAGWFELTLQTEPGAFSRLFLGSNPIVQPGGATVIEKLVTAEQTLDLGNVPPTGVLDMSLALDPSWSSGTVIYAQAMSIFPGGEIRRTNSVPVVIP